MKHPWLQQEWNCSQLFPPLSIFLLLQKAWSRHSPRAVKRASYASPHLSLSLSLKKIVFSDTTVHSNSFFCRGFCIAVSTVGDPPGNLHISQEYSTVTYFLISLFSPFWKPLVLTLNFWACRKSRSLAVSVSSWSQKHSGGSVFIPWNASFLKRDKNRTSLVLLPQGLVLKGSWLLKEHWDCAGTKLHVRQKMRERQEAQKEREKCQIFLFTP